jgi:putative transposase
MGIKDGLMKIVVKVQDVVALARHFERAPREAMREVVAHVQQGAREALEQVMHAEIEMFLGQEAERDNKRNGYVTRDFALKGLGTVRVRVPRDRAGRFETKVVPARRRYDEDTEKDLALLHLSGLSTRTLAHVSQHVLGLNVSRSEVSSALKTIVPAAKQFLVRPLGERRWKYLYIDGTNFHVRRTTVDREPTLVVVGVDETDHKSVLAMVQGDKDSRPAWEMVFAELKERGLDPTAVQLGIMDGLPGLADAFCEAFSRARVARCWVHKARNVLPRVARRYQAAFQVSWDAMQYAEHGAAAREAFAALKARWNASCADAVACLERDLELLLVHYEFPRAHWDALRTTNPIERVNKEFKRRAKAMDSVGPDGLQALLAFTALRLEFGWSQTPLTSGKISRLPWHKDREARRMEALTKGLLH